MRIHSFVLLTLIVAADIAQANPAGAQGQPQQGQPPQEQGRQGRVPPPEAFSACDGKQAGAVVTFTTRRGETMTGTCRMFPARLVAMPDHPPQGGDGGRQGGPQGGPPNGQPGH